MSNIILHFNQCFFLKSPTGAVLHVQIKGTTKLYIPCNGKKPLSLPHMNKLETCSSKENKDKNQKKSISI